MSRLFGIALLLLGLVCWRSYQGRALSEVPSDRVAEVETLESVESVAATESAPVVVAPSSAVEPASEDSAPSREPAQALEREPSLEEIAEINVRAGVIRPEEKADLIEHLLLVQERDAREREGFYP